MRFPFSLVLCFLASLGSPVLALAQLRPDSTLGRESSVVTPSPVLPGFFVIEGGASRGSNLFHSFDALNITEREAVYFANPAGVEAIFSRVTGSDRSDILGTLGVLGDADLFLLNPNGILFGENARLDVRGSFFATSADAIEFGDRGSYSARNPAAPAPLLTIDPSAFLFQQELPGVIENRSIADNPPGSGFFSGLQVPPGESLVLLGGDVILNAGRLVTLGGHVEIGSVGGTGRVGLAEDSRLVFPEGLMRNDVTLENGAQILVSLQNGGDIGITANNIHLVGSRLNAGIESGFGSPTRQAGDIVLNATGAIRLRDGSQVFNNVAENAVGNGGNIEINARELRVNGNSQISASTGGAGNAGQIGIAVRDRIILSDLNAAAAPAVDNRSGVFSAVGSTAVGNGGNIEIAATELRVLGGARIDSSTEGEGNAGTIRINAGDRIFVTGTNTVELFVSVIASTAESGSVGDGGNIEMNTGALQVRNGGRLTASTLSAGDAGNITIDADEQVRFAGTSAIEQIPTLIVSSVAQGGQGDGGNITIAARTLQVRNGASIFASTLGNGDAGSIRIRAREQVTFANPPMAEPLTTGASSTVEEIGVGDGGGIVIRTGALNVRNGALVNANTFGMGDAGSILIRARDRATFAGTDLAESSFSAAASQVGRNARGNGGTLAITTGNLQVRGGAQLSTNAFGVGNAGDIAITADRLTLAGVSESGELASGIFSQVVPMARGNSGEISISTDVLQVRDGAAITSSMFGAGDAGSIAIRAGDRTTFSDTSFDGRFASGVYSNLELGARGDGGGIFLRTGTLQLLNGGRLSSATSGRGNAGGIRVVVQDAMRLSGISANGLIPSLVVSAVNTTGRGRGGGIVIRAASLEVLEGAQLLASTLGRGDAGNIQITTSDRTILSSTTLFGQAVGGAFSTIEQGAVGNGGDIAITTQELQVLNGGAINASTSGIGDAGDIVIQAGDRAIFTGTSADGQFFSAAASQVERSATGEGGSIEIRTRTLQVQDGAGLSTSTGGNGNAGNIFLHVEDQVSLDQGSIFAVSEGTGTGGDIRLNTDQLILENQSAITTLTLLTDGGNIALNVEDLLLLRTNSLISTEAGIEQGGGDGGNIRLDNAGGFILAVPQEDSDIVANAFEGQGGNIRITTQGIFGLEFRSDRTPFSDITASSEIGVDGEVEIVTPNVDPTQGLVALPTEVVDAANQIGQICPTGPGAADRLGSFVSTGRGGITPSPLSVLDAPEIGVDWLEEQPSASNDGEAIDGEATDGEATDGEELPSPQSQERGIRLVEANSWRADANGRVQLIAQTQQGVEMDAEAECP